MTSKTQSPSGLQLIATVRDAWSKSNTVNVERDVLGKYAKRKMAG